jgi:hypothetical protein
VLCFVASTLSFALEVPDIIIASIGAITFLIFASQKDVLVLWRVAHPTASFTESRVTGSDSRDRHTTHEQPPLYLYPLYPPRSLSQSRVSSIFEIPEGPKKVHHLSIRVDQIELGQNFNDSARDKNPTIC